MKMVGRKRAFAKRERNGRALRAATAQRESAELESRQSETFVVLAQAHRRGNADQRCESPFGRFCIRKGLRTEILRAGEEYADLVRRWRAAKGIPTEERLGIGGNGLGPSDATVRDWGFVRGRCDRAMSDASYEGYLAVVQMLLYHADLGFHQDDVAILALAALAREMGTMTSEHPFA